LSAVRGLALAVLFALGSASAAPSLAAERFDGVVTRVSDGDTLWVRPDPSPQRARPRPLKLRLVGLDAPERCQAHGAEAGAALSDRVLGRRVSVTRRATDTHGRALGSVSLDGDDIGRWLVSQGHAWSSGYRGDPGPYAGPERAARASRRGVFADPAPEPPRAFRRRHGPC
jgi:micrococcal nuclease